MTLPIRAALAFAVTMPLPAAAQADLPDLFIGTLALDRGDVILTRCDLGQTRYLLRDAKGGQAVARYRAAAKPGYAEVVASYREEAGRHVLTVREFATIQPGRSCHLTDAVNGVEAAALAGHYYLSGVTEVGSELMLRTDGSFTWFLAYGAMDQTAQGKWRVENGAVVLDAAAAPAKPLFAYHATLPWSPQAEQARQASARREAEEKAEARCAFLQVPQATPAPMIGEAPAAAPPARDPSRDAAQALRTALEARSRAERLAGRAAADAATAQDREAAQQAISDWQTARGTARRAAEKAGLAEPALEDFALPAACTPSVQDNAKDAARSTGLAVAILDAALNEPAKGVQVALRFADGHVERLTTDDGGLAFVPASTRGTATGATVEVGAGESRTADIAFAPVSAGVIQIAIDLQQLVPAPFTQLRLPIAGNALMLEGATRGRYERQP